MASSGGDETSNAALQSLNTELHAAAKAVDVVRLRAALAAGADVDAIMPNPPFKETPLCVVVEVGDPDDVEDCSEEDRTACVRALLEAGANPSALVTLDGEQHEGGHQALHTAVFEGFYTITKMLLDAGADVNARFQDANKDNLTPLFFTTDNTDTPEDRKHRIIALLLSRGAVCTSLVSNPPPYLRKVRAAGGFANYAKQHRAKLVATLAPKFAHVLPPELVSVMITFRAPVGLH